MKDSKHIKIRMSGLAVLLAVCFFGSFLMGKYAIDPVTLVKILLSRVVELPVDWTVQDETVLFNVRLPRVIMGAVIGGGLACAGAAYQGIFQNPMVSPDILGASNGAAFGAALGLFFSIGYQAISVSAFLFGIMAVVIVLAISRRVKFNVTLELILAGIMVGSIFNAGVSYLKLVADPTDTLPAITYWLMGSLASTRTQDVFFAGPPIIIGILPILLLRWRLNVLTMGDEEARTMGINAKVVRTIVIGGATLITAAAVSVSGLIGWVGLVIPHFARMIVGDDYRVMLPASVLLGSSFLLVVDNFARMLATREIPIGILTAFIGAPFFLYLILKEGGRQ
ncbi:MAG: transport system permease protein [Bacillota bacterium]|nr:transport system permease protein [Bacillota bacterium]